jgi:hypothetical protein
VKVRHPSPLRVRTVPAYKATHGLVVSGDRPPPPWVGKPGPRTLGHVTPLFPPGVRASGSWQSTRWRTCKTCQLHFVSRLPIIHHPPSPVPGLGTGTIRTHSQEAVDLWISQYFPRPTPPPKKAMIITLINCHSACFYSARAQINM